MSGQYQERKEYFKQYREKNKERLQQKRHDYYEENIDRIKEYAEQWKQDNPSMVWLQKQEYFEKNKDKINEYRRRKYAENKEAKNLSFEKKFTYSYYTATNLAPEFRPYYETKVGTGGTYMLWYDYAVIKLNHFFESIDHIGLTQKLDAQLRLWLNCGTVNVTVAGAGTSNMAYNITPANNTFSNTLINSL
jgi:hypothetical protein